MPKGELKYHITLITAILYHGAMLGYCIAHDYKNVSIFLALVILVEVELYRFVRNSKQS